MSAIARNGTFFGEKEVFRRRTTGIRLQSATYRKPMFAKHSSRSCQTPALRRLLPVRFGSNRTGPAPSSASGIMRAGETFLSPRSGRCGSIGNHLTREASASYSPQRRMLHIAEQCFVVRHSPDGFIFCPQGKNVPRRRRQNAIRTTTDKYGERSAVRPRSVGK